MGLMDVARDKSIWRGLDYYNDKKVEKWESTSEGCYEGVVSESGDNKYIVHIDTKHPKRSTCTCPFAKDRKVVCKHMIALYFTVEPKAAVDFFKEDEEWEAEEEERNQQHYEDLRKYVMRLSKRELQDRLLDALIQLEDLRYY